MPERYHLNAQDRDLVQAATILLKKAAAAETLRPAELVSVAKLQHVLSALPRVTPDLGVTVQVTGARREFGEIETWHYWEVAVEGDRLRSQHAIVFVIARVANFLRHILPIVAILHFRLQRGSVFFTRRRPRRRLHRPHCFLRHPHRRLPHHHLLRHP